MIWVIAAIAAWLLPAVLLLCVFLVIAVRDLCSNLVIALRRRQAGDNQPSRSRSRNITGHA